MKYFFDTEFFENGPQYPIALISIGIVADDGRELYLENADFNWSTASDWLKQNVQPHMRGPKVAFKAFGPTVLDFVQVPAGKMTKPEFWAYYADYDWVVFCQMFGRMIDLPKNFPMYCCDLKQWADQLGAKKTDFPKQDEAEHHALYDARWNRQLYDFLRDSKPTPVDHKNFQL